MASTSRSAPLTRQDWARAGMDALAEAGLAGVRVEVIAETLGATKGSFYWHFRDRADLVAAVLETWEQVATIDVIAHLATHDDPRERLRALFRLTVETPGIGAVEAALLAAARDPQVAPTLSRVTARRIDYMADVFAETGLGPPVARRAALQAYLTWIGLVQLRSAVPTVLPPDDEEGHLLRDVLASLDGLIDGPGAGHRRDEVE